MESNNKTKEKIALAQIEIALHGKCKEQVDLIFKYLDKNQTTYTDRKKLKELSEQIHFLKERNKNLYNQYYWLRKKQTKVKDEIYE